LRGPYTLFTKDMTAEERQEWWNANPESDLKNGKYGRGESDLGPDIPIPAGKVRCHGMRLVKKTFKITLNEWYKQSPTRMREQGW
jgi:hypothetical protein